jgi:hypothetical protein
VWARRALCALALIALFAFAGCGGSAGDKTVAQVGSSKISESMLNHWVATFVRGDFYQVVGRRAPEGLATDPPNYPSCVRAAKTLAPSLASGKPRLDESQLDVKCHQLYANLRSEALSYLISVLWAEGEGAELGRKVSDAEVQSSLNQIEAKQHPGRQAFMTFLHNKGWSLADIHYVYKRNLLQQTIFANTQKKAREAGGSQQALVSAVVRRNAKWTAKTKCSAGLVVWQCPNYHATKTSTPSPAVIFEEMGQR